MKFNMYFKNIKNKQFNSYIFKICNHVNLSSKSIVFKLGPNRMV